MERGVVKWFDAQKRFGFITADSEKKDYFVHFSNVETEDQTLEKGEMVEFEAAQGAKGPEARKVRRVES
jgi:cold shock protein